MELESEITSRINLLHDVISNRFEKISLDVGESYLPEFDMFVNPY